MSEVSLAWSMAARPEELLEHARTQVAESGAILQKLAERRDVSDEAFECEIRLQMMWLGVAANKIHEAGKQKAAIDKARKLYARREGPAA